MNRRIFYVALGLLCLYSVLIVQFFRIQIVHGAYWSTLAAKQHEYSVPIPCKRGSFYSNTSIKKGHPEEEVPFVQDVIKYHLFCDPSVIPPLYFQEIAAVLGEFLKVDQHELIRQYNKKGRSRRLAKWLSVEQHRHLLTWWKSFARKNKIPENALVFMTDYQRCYPFGSLLGQVLHTIQERKDNQGNALPTGGLEAYFHPLLEGRKGKRLLTRSPRNAMDGDRILEEPIDGADIYLTVNHHIQAICEDELMKGVLAAQAKEGWVVMLDPYTGEVLAYAQYPLFDPSRYNEYFNDPIQSDHTRAHGFQDAYEMGSVLKPLIVSIALLGNQESIREGKPLLWDPEEPSDVSQGFFPGRTRPLRDIGSYRTLNLNMALQRSSNIYMAHIVDRILRMKSAVWYRQQLYDLFGIGKPLGLEFPAEGTGWIPKPGKMLNNGKSAWSLATPYSIALGYNLLCTPLQVATAFCTIANGGYQVRPTLIKKIERKKKHGEIELLYKHLPERKAVLPQEVCARVMEGMKYVTKPNGSGALGDIFGFSEAGKTGTAERIIDGSYSKELNLASFVGFAPARTDFSIPARILILVCLNEPTQAVGRGGKCATPVFREIARRTLEYLGVEPDDPGGYPKGDPRFCPEKADWYNETKQLKLLFEQWNHVR